MWRKRNTDRTDSGAPAARTGKFALNLANVLPVLAGAATTTAILRYLLSRKRRKPGEEEVGVLHAEVHSNGQSKVSLDSLDSFS